MCMCRVVRARKINQWLASCLARSYTGGEFLEVAEYNVGEREIFRMLVDGRIQCCRTCVCIRDSGRDCYRAFFFSLPLLARAAPATVAHGVSRRVPKPAAMGPRCRWRARQSSREKEFYYSPVPRVVREKEFKQKNSLSQQTGSTQVRTGAC